MSAASVYRDHVIMCIDQSEGRARARMRDYCSRKKNPSGLSPYVYLVAVVRNWWGGWSGGESSTPSLWRHTGFCVNRQVLCLRLRHFKRKKFIKAHAMCSIQWVNTIITVCMYCAAEYYSPSVVSRYISGCIVAKCSLYLCTPSRVDAIDPRTVWADKERLQLSVPSLHWHGNHKRIIIYLLVTWNRGVKVLS